jgi:hypothetical protein
MYKTVGILYGLGMSGYVGYKTFCDQNTKDENVRKFIVSCFPENSRCTEKAVTHTLNTFFPTTNSAHKFMKFYRSVEKGLTAGVLSGVAWPVVGPIHVASLIENSVNKRFCD